jgi:hypothetical protein
MRGAHLNGGGILDMLLFGEGKKVVGHLIQSLRSSRKIKALNGTKILASSAGFASRARPPKNSPPLI